MMNLWLIAGVLILTCPVILSVQASAINQHIAIDLSKTCTVFLKNNLTTQCPTYADILTVFPDTSNRLVSGDFGFSDDGFYERQPTKFKEHFNFYRSWPNDVLWVDTPGDVRGKVKTITITSTDFEYKLPGQTITNGSFKVGQSRHVSEKCDSVIITAQNWLFLLGDSIRYIMNDCEPDATFFDEVKIKTWEVKNHDITTSVKYKLQQWQQESIERCGQKICKNEKTKFNPERAG